MNDQTLEALKGSIKKWQEVRDGERVEHGSKDCPLCELFLLSGCQGCPVSERSGRSNCANTPYYYWIENGGCGRRATTPDMRRLAGAELKFLKSLLPKKEPKKMFVFWSYDLFPYVLGGIGTKEANGFYHVEPYQASFKPTKVMEIEEGKALFDQLTDLNAARQVVDDEIHSGFAARLNQLAPWINDSKKKGKK